MLETIFSISFYFHFLHCIGHIFNGKIVITPHVLSIKTRFCDHKAASEIPFFHGKNGIFIEILLLKSRWPASLFPVLKTEFGNARFPVAKSPQLPAFPASQIISHATIVQFSRYQKRRPQKGRLPPSCSEQLADLALI